MTFYINISDPINKQMSHTTSLKSVPVTSVSALKAAVKELQKAGVNIDLLQNAEPRMYYDKQITKQVATTTNHGLKLHANPEECDYVVALPDAAYDIGFIWNEKKTELIAQFDAYSGRRGQTSIRDQVGDKSVEGHVGHVAKLMQSYAKHAAIQQATSQGYKVTGTKIDAEGAIQIQVTV